MCIQFDWYRSYLLGQYAGGSVDFVFNFYFQLYPIFFIFTIYRIFSHCKIKVAEKNTQLGRVALSAAGLSRIIFIGI